MLISFESDIVLPDIKYKGLGSRPKNLIGTFLPVEGSWWTWAGRYFDFLSISVYIQQDIEWEDTVHMKVV